MSIREVQALLQLITVLQQIKADDLLGKLGEALATGAVIKYKKTDNTLYIAVENEDGAKIVEIVIKTFY